jgi:hypothetical protein
MPFFSHSHIYADDVQMYLSGSEENLGNVVDQINTDLTSILDWATRNALCLNSQKTKATALPTSFQLEPAANLL